MMSYAHLPELNFLRWMRDALTMSDGEFIVEFQRLSKSDINDFYEMYRCNQIATKRFTIR